MGYLSRVNCSGNKEMSDRIMSRLTGKARDIVKVSLRSRPVLLASMAPTAVFDILKRNFSELTYSNMPMADFYGTVPRAGEGVMDYWIRLNKAIDVADECLRRRGRCVEDSSAEVVMMFISHCPDPGLAMSFQLKPVEQWAAAEVQERLDNYQRDLRRSGARARHAVDLSTCSQSPVTVDPSPPAAQCSGAHQLPMAMHPPQPRSFSSPPAQYGEPHTYPMATQPIPLSPAAPALAAPTPAPSPASPSAVDPGLHQVVGLFEKVLSLCAASLVPATRAQPGQLFRSHNQPSPTCKVCGDRGHDTYAHCRLHKLCRNCFRPGHFKDRCPSISQPSAVPTPPFSSPAPVPPFKAAPLN